MDTRTLLRNVRIRLLNVISQKNGVLVRSCLSLWVEAFAFLVQLRCDSTSAAVTGSESGHVIRNIVSSDTFSHNCVVKIVGWFQTTHFDQKKRCNEGNVCDKYKIWKTTFKLRRRHFLMNCRRGVCVITACPSSQVVHQLFEDDCKKSSTEVCGEKIRRFFLPLQNLLTASRQLHDSLSSCCCLLLVPINVLRHLGASVSTSVSDNF
jgi:hypothetical protein